MSARSRGALALALAALWSLPAHAEGAPQEDEGAARVLLEWTRGPGAESCLAPEAAAIEVERLLARPVFATTNTDRRLVVSIERTTDPPGYEAHMSLFAASGAPLGSREIAIAAERCEQATEAFTLALSIMADFPRTPEEDTSPPRPQPPEAPAPPARPSPAPPRSPRGRFAVGVGPAAAIVTGSAISPGGHLAVLFEPRSFLPVLGGLSSTLRPHETFASRSAWLSSTRIEAALCLPPLAAKGFALFGCLGPEATIHLGWGAGFGEDRSGLATTFGGIARAYARHAVGTNLHLFASIALAATPQTLEVAFTDASGARRTALATTFFSPSLSIGVAFDDYLGTP